MPAYTFFLFNRHGQCVYYRDWQKKERSAKKIEESQKLMFGLLFSTKAFVKQMNPIALGEMEKPQFSAITTQDYKIHHWESVSGLRFALTTDPNVGSVSFEKFYELYVDEAMKNPLYTLNTPITHQGFTTKIDALLVSMSLMPRA